MFEVESSKPSSEDIVVKLQQDDHFTNSEHSKCNHIPTLEPADLNLSHSEDTSSNHIHQESAGKSGEDQLVVSLLSSGAGAGTCKISSNLSNRATDTAQRYGELDVNAQPHPVVDGGIRNNQKGELEML